METSVENHTIAKLPAAATAFITALSTIAAVVIVYSVSRWQTANMGQFLLYLTCGILSSNLKVKLPGVPATLSMNFLFILAAAIDLNLPQAVVVGSLSGLTQLLWSARIRPRVAQVLFTFSSMVISAALASEVFRASWISTNLPFRLLCASFVYSVCNHGSFGLILLLTEGSKSFLIWRSHFLWIAPHYIVGSALAGFLHLWIRFAGWQSAVLVFPAIYFVYHSYRIYLGRLEQEKRHVDDMADLHLRTIQALALAIDARDGHTHSHLRRVQVYAREMAHALGLPETECQALDAAALLHDIGKLAVPEHIISKPGKLTPEEFEKMKVHPLIGAEILDSVRFPYPVVPIVQAHHERWDGTGYPYGLKGEEIPIAARIVSAVDCLDALSSDRQYRRALPLDEAMRAVAAESGSAFDPRVIEVLQRRYREFEALARQQIPDPPPFPTEPKIENGCAPAAGFEPSAQTPISRQSGFVASIAAARQEFHTLLELTSDLGNSLRVDETMALLTARLRALIPFDGVAIYTIQDGRLATRYAAGDDAVLFSSLAIPLGEGISGWVTQNNKPIVNGNPSVEPGYLGDPEKFSMLRSALSVPLPGIKGTIGALTLYHRSSAAFNRDHLRVLLAISSKAGLTIENALRFVQAEETAITDALTGLPNARSLFLRLDEALQIARDAGSMLAVLVADMDGFKQVNDQFGHATGNRVLVRTAEAFRQTIRSGDYAARMGGDEFVMLIPGAQAFVIHQRAALLDELVAEVGRQVCNADLLRLSVGASYFPTDALNAEELLAIADTRMYEVKRERHRSAETLETEPRVDNIFNLARAVADSPLAPQPGSKICIAEPAELPEPKHRSVTPPHSSTDCTSP